ncbi:MAG TPA: biotin transporter BioY [Clostridiales bacterium]|jgi:biotin transport system substrate-specific component|nr:biotin transporter BioY [Clostridiales bacterium]
MLTTTKLTTKKLILTGMFTAIISIMAQITIHTQPIPFTLSFLAIFLTGIMLEPKCAFLAVLSYILLGAFGLPVFAGFRGGFHVISGMTGGYIIGYPLMALITSISYQISIKLKPKRYFHNIVRTAILITGMVASLAVDYLIGTLWFSFVSGSTIAYSLTVCVFPFVVFDLLKIALAVSFGTAIRKVVDRIT